MAKRKASQVGASGQKAEPSKSIENTPTELSIEHQNFCRHYARWGNATLAYGFAYPNAKKTTCGANGHVLLKNTEVQEFISHLKEQDKITLNFSRQDALRILIAIAIEGSDKNKIGALSVLTEKLGLDKEPDSGSGEASDLDISSDVRRISESRKN